MIAVVVILIVASLSYIFVIREKISGKKEVAEGTSHGSAEVRDTSRHGNEE
ncbi:MAG: hypothetical protein JXA22_00610 [Candidatus Thermoplasmatota archaeon]|nr:hypothetical protein [Candidatus Thermoplasmatota archaeon]